MLNRVGILILPAHKPKKAKAAAKQREVRTKPMTKQARLWMESQGRCHYCGSILIRKTRKQKHLAMPPHQTPTIDHKTPKSKGGSSAIGNLVLACMACNFRKADKPYEVFIMEIRNNEA